MIKRQTKKILAMFLAVITICSLFPFSSMAEISNAEISPETETAITTVMQEEQTEAVAEECQEGVTVPQEEVASQEETTAEQQPPAQSTPAEQPKAEVQETSAETETAAKPKETAKEGMQEVRERVETYEDDTVIITATMDETAIPPQAEFKCDPIDPKSDQYSEIRQN